MTSLAQRTRQSEQMDDPELDPAVYRAVLGDLAQVNRWTMASRATLSFLGRGVGNAGGFSLLDVGFGHGDMLRRVARWARRRKIEAELVGIDINPHSEAAARAATPGELRVDYRTGDYRDIARKFDFIISSLVAHHMSDRELRQFVRHMEAHSRRGWLINDLHRHRVAHRGFPLLARLMRVHPLVRQDGTLSIARSFRPADWQRILDDAGVDRERARIVRQFPFRLCVERLF